MGYANHDPHFYISLGLPASTASSSLHVQYSGSFGTCSSILEIYSITVSTLVRYLNFYCEPFPGKHPPTVNRTQFGCLRQIMKALVNNSGSPTSNLTWQCWQSWLNFAIDNLTWQCWKSWLNLRLPTDVKFVKSTLPALPRQIWSERLAPDLDYYYILSQAPKLSAVDWKLPNRVRLTVAGWLPEKALNKNSSSAFIPEYFLVL